MNEETVESRIDRIRAVVLNYLAPQDDAAIAQAGVNSGGKIDMTVISTVFEGMDSLERETRVWPAFRSLDTADLISMTYCLFLTPEEAAEQFAGSGE